MQQIIDLTHMLHEGTTVFPGSDSPVFEQINNIEQHGYAQIKMNLLSHHGTHMDAPAHMIQNSKTLDQFGPEQFFGKAVCVDCTRLNNALIPLEHLLPYENELKQVDFVLFHTGWSEKWSEKAYFIDFPVLSNDSCRWLCNFKLKGLGLDTISIDEMDSSDLLNHKIVLGQGMVIIENLTNLKDIGKGIFTFSCFPIKYKNADGSPIRAIAIL